ncbi:MAG: DUF2330 domain-containing protein [Myxococcales bacterium]|nr:DUF2330 domain-containing protein [Myxococcales bacterium]
MSKKTVWALCFLALALRVDVAAAFCGFYVAKADTKLFNESSQVVLVRDGDRTVLTMANDFQGDPLEFAMVVPVPTFIEREQIHVGDKAVIDHLDAYTAPRLVEYFDEDPCDIRYRRRFDFSMNAFESARAEVKPKANVLGVTIEASYTVGEYDILILSAKESGGLETWLRQNGYRIPDGASDVLGSYIKQEMRFFVAKVNLEEQAKIGFTYLRPLQIAYETPRFMLPIRLGTVNAKGPQELFVYTLTRKGRVETTNYRTVKLPTGTDVPVYVKEEFGDFYKAMFDTQTEKEGGPAVFVEYAWDMNWCDPCAADPLSHDELKGLGVFWLGDPRGGETQPMRRPIPQARDVFVTRLHVRYDAERFPDDLVFQETGDRTNFQGRYVLRHAWDGESTCDQADAYRKSLPDRWEKEAQSLASLTGWDINAIRSKMKFEAPGPFLGQKWWERLWN